MRIILSLALSFYFSLFVIGFANASGLKPFLHETPRPVPNILFQDKEQRTYTLSEFKGKVILVNFWATWCKPCVEEMPSFSRFQQATKKLGIFVFPISVGAASVEDLERFYKRHNIKGLPVLKDYRRTFSAAKVGGLPTTLVVNRKGEEVARVTGSIKWDDDYLLQQLLLLDKTGSVDISR